MQTSPPPRHKWISTDDGSLTLYSEDFQEGCHSTSGARSETLLHYVNGCQVPRRASLMDHFTILEVGFGLGIGFTTTYEALQASSRPWKFVSLEIDRELVEWFVSGQKLEAHWEGNLLKAQVGNCELNIIIGDARKALPDYLATHQVRWHAIYQDAFSPKRNPLLWTREWFSLLKAHSHEEVIMSTYSASTSIRRALLEAGWKITKGDKFGPKRSSTRARLQGESDEDVLLQLERSPSPALSDDNIEQFLRGWKA